MNDSATMVRLLDSIREHLATQQLPAEIATVTVGTDLINGEHVTVHLRRVELLELAAALLAWADTLTHITVTAWRPRHGETVHLTLTGQLPDTTSAEVYGGVDYSDDLFGDLQPDGRQGVALSILRAWAAGNSAVAA
jgi:hypothetical protein